MLSPFEFLVGITVSADPPLAGAFTFDERANTIKFSGELEDGAIPIVTSAKVSITVTTSLRN